MRPTRVWRGRRARRTAMEAPTAAKFGMKPWATESPQWVVESTRTLWLTSHCSSVEVATRVESVVKIVVKMPMIKIVIRTMEAVLAAKIRPDQPKIAVAKPR